MELVFFRKIVLAITSYDIWAKQAVDYVTSVLLYDNLDLLRKITNIN